MHVADYQIRPYRELLTSGREIGGEYVYDDKRRQIDDRIDDYLAI